MLHFDHSSRCTANDLRSAKGTKVKLSAKTEDGLSYSFPKGRYDPSTMAGFIEGASLAAIDEKTRKYTQDVIAANGDKGKESLFPTPTMFLRALGIVDLADNPAPKEEETAPKEEETTNRLPSPKSAKNGKATV